MSISTVTTRDAAMAMKQAIRTFLGMRLRTREMMTLLRVSTKMTAAPIPRPFSAVLVTARTGHSPSTSRKGGSSFHKPLVNSCIMLAIRFSCLLGSAAAAHCLPRTAFHACRIAECFSAIVFARASSSAKAASLGAPLHNTVPRTSTFRFGINPEICSTTFIPHP